ncbi:tRNA pseudouridine(55) synthase TruB [Candidatus Margulisiibacteriota bacterium]
MDGIIIVDKPQGWTSFDVCAKIRNLTKTKKVGHSGTLDPMATGLLLVFLGKATKIIQYFVGDSKEYLGELTLGAVTDSMDATGTLTRLREGSPPLPEGEGCPKDRVRDIFKNFIGKQKQKPPMYSAKKINGKKLYELARKGIEIERPDKDIEIYSLDLLGISDNKIRFKVKCTKGTYIRVLAHAIGYELGCGAYLSALRRTAAGEFRIEQSITIDQIISLSRADKLDTILLPYEQTRSKA